MIKWIEAIYLRYDEADKEVELYVRLFFQMIGVYVYEQSTDIIQKFQIRNIDYFADIIFLSSKSIQYHKELLREQSAKSIYLVLDENVLNEIEILDSKNIIYCNYERPKDRLLPNIIHTLKRIYFSVATEDESYTFFDEWMKLAYIYTKEKMSSHMYVCECFVADVRLLQTVQTAYNKFIGSVFKKWKLLPGKCNYFRYAILYIAYSLNQYCMRNNEAYAYSIDNLKKLIEPLVRDMQGNPNVVLLQAKIYKNLFREFGKAREIYENLQKKVAWGSVYYGLGKIYEEYDNDYMKAIKYYRQSSDWLAERYLSLYCVAQCWKKMGELKRAVAAWREVNEIIRIKKEHRGQSLIELGYMFESAISMGDIWREDKNGYVNAEIFYESAEEIYDKMGKEPCMECMLKNEYSMKYLVRVAKKSHDKAELLHKLYFTNILLGKVEKAKKYQYKIRKEEEDYERV